MANCEILEGIDDEVQDFEDKENKRPMWPDCPTRCPVPDCSTDEYNSFSSFLRHWENKHKSTVTLFHCPNCRRTSARKTNITSHQRAAHKMTSSIFSQQEPNKKYLDPGATLPYQFNHRQRMATKRQRQDITGDILVRGGEVCRDQVAEFSDSGAVNVVFKRSRKDNWQ